MSESVKPRGKIKKPAPAWRREWESLDPASRRQLLKKLQALPEVRPEAVELGRRLAKDPGYPSRETLAKLAAKLARAGGDGIS